MLLKLPRSARHRIYTLVIPHSRVEIEVTDDLFLLTKHSHFLRISKAIRKDILDACSNDTLELIHTFRSPSSLISANTSGLSRNFTSIRIVLMAWIEDNNISLDQDSLCQAITTLFRDWRTAFSGLASVNPLKLVYFDFTNSFGADVHQPAKLLNMLSVVVQRRSQKQANCKIAGCKTTHGQRFLENHTVGFIREFPNWEPKKVNPGAERAAGVVRPGPSRDYPLRSEVSPQEYARWEDWAITGMEPGDRPML